MFALLAFVALASAKTYPLTIKSCGPADQPLKIHTLTVLPDKPIDIRKNLTITFDLEATREITEAKVVLKFEKEVLFWITLPCEKNIGSCTYDNICTILDTYKDKCLNATRPAHPNVPCSCPIPAGRFSATINVPPPEIPASIEWLASGNYKIHFQATDSTSTLGCYDAQFSLKA